MLWGLLLLVDTFRVLVVDVKSRMLCKSVQLEMQVFWGVKACGLVNS
jgi:hypothetical protein